MTRLFYKKLLPATESDVTSLDDWLRIFPLDNLAQKGVPIKTLMKMGGWSRIETVEKFYIRCTDANEQEAVEI